MKLGRKRMMNKLKLAEIKSAISSETMVVPLFISLFIFKSKFNQESYNSHKMQQLRILKLKNEQTSLSIVSQALRI